jgi:hypothetical protein
MEHHGAAVSLTLIRQSTQNRARTHQAMGTSDVSNNLEYRTITDVNGRSRTVVEGYPTTTNLFEFQSDSAPPNHAKTHQNTTNAHPMDHETIGRILGNSLLTDYMGYKIG